VCPFPPTYDWYEKEERSARKRDLLEVGKLLVLLLLRTTITA